MKSDLNQSQMKMAKKLAHHLEPVVYIGQQGLTENIIAKTDESLLAHELIKVKFGGYKDQKQNIIQSLTESTDSLIVDLIGHVAILYRPHPDIKQRRILL